MDAIMPGEGELLSIQPNEIELPFELKKQISCTLRLVNTTDKDVAYKVKTTAPLNYRVRPNSGLLSPKSSAEVLITMQALQEAPAGGMQCVDKFMVQSVIAPTGTTAKDLPQELFDKAAGKSVRNAILRVVFVAPPPAPKLPHERLHLSIQPNEIKLPFELKKQISCPLRLENTTDKDVAYKVKTTAPKNYRVRPNSGLLPPQSSAEVLITMQALQEAPAGGMQCEDKFLVQSVIAPVGTTAKDLAQSEFFDEAAGKSVREAKLSVVFVAAPPAPSPLAESAEEVMSPKLFTEASTGRSWRGYFLKK